MNNTTLFFMSYSVLTFSTVFALSLFPSVGIDVYFLLFAVEFFIASELSSPMTYAESRRKAAVGVLLVALFIVVVSLRIVEILGW